MHNKRHAGLKIAFGFAYAAIMLEVNQLTMLVINENLPQFCLVLRADGWIKTHKSSLAQFE